MIEVLINVLGPDGVFENICTFIDYNAWNTITPSIV